MKDGSARAFPRFPWRLFGCVLTLLLVLTGCAEEAVVCIPRWTLVQEGSRHPIELPTHVDDLLVPSTTSYVLTTTVTVPETWRHQDLTFAIPYFPSSSRLFVAGKEISSLDERASWEQRPVTPHRFRIPAELVPPSVPSDLVLELRADRNTPWSGWWDTLPRLSPTPWGDRHVRWLRAWVLLSGIFALSITVNAMASSLHSVMTTPFVYHRWALLHESLAAIYPLYALGWLRGLFGSWELFALTVALFGLTAAMGFRTRLVDGPLRRWVFVALCILGSLTGLPQIDASPLRPWATRTAILLLGILGGVVALHPTRDFETRGPALRWIMRIMLPVGLLCALPDMISFLGLGAYTGSLRLGSFGIALVTIMALATYPSSAGNLAEEAIVLKNVLEERLGLLEKTSRDVQLLNEELQRQLALKASELATAILHASRQEARQDLQVGATVDHRYVVTGLLGRGGMGTVFEVTRLSDSVSLAMKVLFAGARPEGFARFAREAQSALQVQSPHVVQVKDVGLTEQGAPFLVMEKVEGQSLAQCTRHYGQVPWACQVLTQVARGLAAIHAADIIHRDLKPGNVLLATADTSAFPLAKISDFGVASIGDSPELPVEGRAPSARLQLTTTGASVGTPMYMAPEVQYGAGGALPATDLFSFGVMARELLGLDSSCYGVPLGMAMRAGAKPTLTLLAQAIPTLPTDVARLLDACLAEEPAHRPTASQLVHALESLSWVASHARR